MKKKSAVLSSMRRVGGREVGVCIAFLRLARGWSQGELAEAAHVTNSAISDYERGKVDPQAATLFKILGALDAPMHLFDQARDFLLSARTIMAGGSILPPGVSEVDELPELPAELAAEIASIATDHARFAARSTRMQLALLAYQLHKDKKTP